LAQKLRVFSIPRPGRVKQYLKARIHAPEIEPEFARHVLDSFGLEMTRPPNNLPLGWRNSNVVVHTPSGKKVLKIYRNKWPLKSIIHEHSILKQLEKLNFQSVRLNSNLNGDSIVNQDGHTCALFDYVDGVNYASSYILRSQREMLVAKSGQTLARFHHQLAGFQPEARHHLGFHHHSENRIRDLSWHLNKIDELREKSPHPEDVEASKHAQWLSDRSKIIGDKLYHLEKTLRAVSLPRLVIHGDYGIHNLLFHQDGTITVHDFELTRIEWRLIDLVTVLTRLDFKRSRVFMAAYQGEYAITSEEWQVFPLVWQYYRLRGSIQYWHNYYEIGNWQRLKAACDRVTQAEEASVYGSKLWQLRKFQGQHQTTRSARVVMVVRLFHPWIGGTERQAHKLALKLLEKQTDVEIVTGWWFRGTSQCEIINGVPVYRNFTFWEILGIKGLRKFGGYLYILSLLWYLWRRRDDYDLIHVHGLNYHTFAAVLAGRWFTKKVVTKLANSAQASDIEKMRQDKQLMFAKYMLPTALKSDRFIALNSTVIQELQAVGVPDWKIIPLPNGVETDLITPKSNYMLHDPIRLIFVGRLHPNKGLDILLNAVAHLKNVHHLENINLQLLGSGPIKDQLMKQAKELGITSLVSFLGETNQVIEVLQQADIFALPSRAEGISNALLEAMACGLPALVSDIPGNRDVIEQPNNGLRFTADDPNSLAQNLLLLLNQPKLREQLGRMARKTVENHYSMDYVADRYTTLYQDLMAGNKEINAASEDLERPGIQNDEA